MNFCLPNTIREPLLQTGRADVVLVLDAIHGLDYDFGGLTTARELARVLWASGILVSPGLVRRALKDDLFPSFVTYDKKRGRPEVFYRIPTLDFLVETVAAGVVLACDELSVDDMNNLRNYRAGLHREFLKRRKKCQHSRKWLGDRLGVGDRATSFYEKDIEKWLTVTADYDVIVLLGMTKDELSEVFSRVVLGRDYLTVSVSTGATYKYGARDEHEQKFPALFSLAWKFVQAGLFVRLKVRKCNVYEWCD
ncbi:MAG: hypothetical protein ABFS03_04015 [Chloroflexota bacterium]